MESTELKQVKPIKQVLNTSITGNSAIFEKDHAKQEQNKNYICSTAVWWTIKAQEKIQAVDGVTEITISPNKFLVSLLKDKYGIVESDLNRKYTDHVQTQVNPMLTGSQMTPISALADIKDIPTGMTQELLESFYHFAKQSRENKAEWNDIRKALLNNGWSEEYLNFCSVKYGDGLKVPTLETPKPTIPTLPTPPQAKPLTPPTPTPTTETPITPQE